MPGEDAPSSEKKWRVYYRYIRNKPRLILTIGITAIVLIGILDYFTGYELGLSPLYFIPIFLITWHLGISTGLAVSLLSTAVWYTAEVHARGHIHNYFIPACNSGIRLIIFSCIAYGAGIIKLAQQRQKELTELLVHDLRAPLTNIHEVINQLREFNSGNLTGDQNSLLSSCAISCKRAKTLITSILDLSRLEAERMEIQRELTSLDDILSLAQEEVPVLAKRRGLQVAVENKASIKALLTDKELLRRVLVNLLSNSIKVSPPEITITVRATDAAGHNMALIIHDQGPGVL